MFTRRLMLIAAILSLTVSGISAAMLPRSGSLDAKDTAKRLDDAAQVLNEIMGTPDKGIPQDLLNKAACAVIIPSVKKGAFIIGAKYGRGFILCRNQPRGWSAPAGVKVEGGSVGFQIGGSETDVVMLVMNKNSVDKLLSSKFTIGADASATAGPVGRTAAAATDAQLHAELLTYSRSRGLFAGVSLDGATLRPDDDSNKDMYGKEMSNKDIVQGSVTAPPAAARLLAELNKYSARRAG